MMSDTLRDMIETQADEVMARLKQCRDRREAVVQELLATYHANQSSVDPVTMAVLIYVLRSGTSYPAITRDPIVTACPELRRLLEGEIAYERRMWTSYTITHDEPGENDQHVAWLELQREQNQFALSVQYLETDALGRICGDWRDTVELSPARAAQYMRDTRDGGWGCEDWTEEQIAFFTESLDWSNRAGRQWFREHLK